MTPKSHTAEEIFAVAVSMSAPTERAAFIASACGEDAVLRAEVESLVAASDQAEGFMQTEQMVVASEVSLSGKPGDTIGP